MKEKIFELIGVNVPEFWTKSNCTSHENLKKEITDEKVIAIVRPDKLKLFGKDKNGVVRCISWPLSSIEPEVEASLLLQQTFGVSLPPVQQKNIIFN